MKLKLKDLPFDCLSRIFDFFPELGQLLKVAKVCKQWRNLVHNRFTKIEHLHIFEKSDLDRNTNHKYVEARHIYTDNIRLIEKLYVAQLFPNLKYFTRDFSILDVCTCKAIANVLATAKPLVGLNLMYICQKEFDDDSLGSGCYCHIDIDEIVKFCGYLEYLSTSHLPLLRSYFFKYKFGYSLKHLEAILYNWANIVLGDFFWQTPNLEKLSLLCPKPDSIIAWSNLNAPMMKLQELHMIIEFGHLKILPLIYFCPNLESLLLDIKIFSNYFIEPLNVSLIHRNLQTLMCTYRFFGVSGYAVAKPMESIKSLLMQFPCCKYLVLKVEYFTVSYEEITEIINLLPNLVFLILHVPGIKNTSSYETFKLYCNSMNRQITFYLYFLRNRTFVRYSRNKDVCRPNKFIQTHFNPTC